MIKTIFWTFISYFFFIRIVKICVFKIIFDTKYLKKMYTDLKPYAVVWYVRQEMNESFDISLNILCQSMSNALLKKIRS